MRWTSWALAAALCAGLPAQEPKKYAILVGIKEYDHSKLESLPYAERDFADLKPLLEKAGYDVKLLTIAAGAADPAAKPTLANIQRELAALLGAPEVRAKVAKRDLVLIALAGHGLQPAGDRDSYFCPQDAQPNSKATLLSVGGLIRSLDESGAGAKLLLVDACRNDPDPSRGRGIDGAAVQSLPQGVAALFSCSPGQRAFETAKAGGGHGVFFHFVLQGLDGKAVNERGEVTWSRLSEYVAERVETGVHEWIGPDFQQVPIEFKNLRGTTPVLIGKTIPVVASAVPDRPKAKATVEMAKPRPPVDAGPLPPPPGFFEVSQVRNKLKMVLVALHMYQDAHGHFPAPDWRGVDGKAKHPHSWRVAILPYLEEGALLKQFNLDEPWDSPTNQAAAAKMPAVYAAHRAAAKPGRTQVSALVAPGAAFERGKEIKLTEFYDGSSSTLLVMLTPDLRPWNQPEDAPVAFDKPPTWPATGALVGYADASVNTLPAKVSPKDWKALLTRSGGETNELGR